MWDIPYSSRSPFYRDSALFVLAYQPPTSSTFLSEQISHQQSASNTFLSKQISTSHQPPAKRTGRRSKDLYLFSPTAPILPDSIDLTRGLLQACSARLLSRTPLIALFSMAAPPPPKSPSTVVSALTPPASLQAPSARCSLAPQDHKLTSTDTAFLSSGLLGCHAGAVEEDDEAAAPGHLPPDRRCRRCTMAGCWLAATDNTTGTTKPAILLFCQMQ
jgi:hypothetical protein